jgi:hypothetical protein
LWRGAAHGEHRGLHRHFEHLAARLQRVLGGFDLAHGDVRDVAGGHVEHAHGGVEERRGAGGAGGQQGRQQAVRAGVGLRELALDSV